MAEDVNMQQSEYEDALPRLTALHAKVITNFAELKTDLIALTRVDGGFYVEQISDKVYYILSSLQEIPLTRLQEIFSTTEQTMSTFLDTIIEIDKLEE